MSDTTHTGPKAAPRSRWPLASSLAEVAVVAAWALFVLRYQYSVGWLQPYEFGLDALFLLAVAAVLAARLFERRGAAAAGAVVLRVAVAATMTAGALYAGEHVLRFMYRDVRSSGNALDYFSQRHAGPRIVRNGLGFREREIPAKTDRFRIAVLGDSFTFGNGLEDTDRLSNQLQAQLGSRYEVFNFGVPGANMPDHRETLRRALGISPDFVLLQLFTNDFETASMRRPRPYPLLPGALDRELQGKSLLYCLLKRQWTVLQEQTGISEGYVRYMQRYLEDPGTPESVASNTQLRGFFRDARAAGVPAGAFMFPAFDALGPKGRGYPFGFLHERMGEICRGEQAECLDLLPLYSEFSDTRPLWVSRFDAHPSAMANRRAVVAILEKFTAAWSTR